MAEEQLPIKSQTRKNIDSTPKLCSSEFCQKLEQLYIPDNQDKASIAAVNDHFSRTRPYSLGLLGNIFERKNCPFCRLLRAILLDVFNVTQEARYNKTTVTWHGLSQGFYVDWRSPHQRTGGKFAFGERITPCLRGGTLSQDCGRVVHHRTLNFSQIRHWLAQCETYHGDLCREKSRLMSPEDSTGVFRLVDLHHNCIIRGSIRERYVALSYVWGKTEPFRLLSKDEAALATPGGLNKELHRIPQTIQDVMQLLTNTGEKYLWVDSMCLLQDNAADLQKGIASMSLIYQAAVVTIIAANSPDAGTGLPRMRSGDAQHVQYLSSVRPGLELMFLRAVDLHLKQSTWNTRGWTFQEQILSRRTITISGNQVFFRCRQSNWSEDTWSDHKPNGNDSTASAASLMTITLQSFDEDDADLHPLANLIVALEAYQQRNLTMDNDAVNAISGYLRPIERICRTAFVEGLPHVAFDLFILFVNSDGLYGPKIHRPVRRRRHFPSWSWAGWLAFSKWKAFGDTDEYEVDEPVTTGVQRWLDRHTWVIWYQYQHGGFSQLIWQSETKFQGQRRPEDLMYKATSQPDLSSRFGRLDTSKFRPSNCYLIKPYPLLIFWTAVITLLIAPMPARSEFEGLYDRKDELCGVLQLDLDRMTYDSRCIQLAILSGHSRPQSQTDPYKRPDIWPGVDLIDPFVESYWVMYIEWVDDVYERRGLGQITQSTLERAFEPLEWKEIVLG